MAYDNRNRGTIAKNTRKSKDTDADITGQLNVNGQDFWINGWLKKNSRDGSTFYSLAVKEKQSKKPSRNEGRDDSFGRNPSGGFGDGAYPDADADTIPF
jgi:hypothetical protein